MDLSEFDFSLQWPQELFVWEARRIASKHANSSFQNSVVCLFAEAFIDGDIAASLERQAGDNIWSKQPVPQNSDARTVLDSLLKNPSVLHPYTAPQYWLERQGGGLVVSEHRSLAQAFVGLIEDMRELDYFPKILRKQCVDDRESWELDPSSAISKAVRADVTWPLSDGPVATTDEMLYSVIEFFHDHAQRPRTRSLHPYGECGWHYDDHNKESGGVVYRWRINELLDRFGVGLRLGSTGAQKGRLIRHANLQLDELAEELSEPSTETGDQKVASAIGLYRARTSSVHVRRGAVAQLAGYLENNRREFKAGELTKGDESDLFNIFNNFAIRHDNKSQKADYGEEYLDWVFWTTLAGISLLKDLRSRGK